MAGMVPVDPTATTLRPMMSGGAPAPAQVPAVPLPPAPAAPPPQSAAQPASWAQAIFGSGAVNGYSDARAALGQGDVPGAIGAVTRANLSGAGHVAVAPFVAAGEGLGNQLYSNAGQVASFGRGLLGIHPSAAIAAAAPAIGAGLVTPAAAATAAPAPAAGGMPAVPAVAQGSPASREQPANPGLSQAAAAPAHHQIPLAILPQMLQLAQAQQRNETMAGLKANFDQEYNEHVAAAGKLTGAEQLKAFKDARDLQNASYLKLLNTPTLQQNTLYGAPAPQ